ncbi:hypothetical protein T265_00125 [Opisthorchis viverrini]|uniref:Homeobox domain-containing protein n=1 Tax=Opisthorchis viverrini TaxID=6198 RepID=A0A075ADK3_OPIVI|nr:hypothetical protein T265_00125 [Opisthorchis viverrini]KER34275.1 hypothetical protein T265_00125 [Opisthorchis viverrini]
MDLTLFGTCDSPIGQDKPSSKPELDETSTVPGLKPSVPTLEDLLTTSPKEIDSGYNSLSYIPSDSAGVEMETPRLPFDSPVCKKDSPPVDMSSAAPQASNETWNLDKGRPNETAIAVASISEFASIPTAVEKGINKVEVCGSCSPTLPWEGPENAAGIGIAQSVHPSGNGEPQLVVSMPNMPTSGQEFSEKSISIQRNDSIATSYTMHNEENSSPTNSEQPVSFSAFQMRPPQQSKHHGDYSIFQLPYNETTGLNNATQLNGMPFTNEDAITLPSVAQDIGFSQPGNFGLGTERFCADETAKIYSDVAEVYNADERSSKNQGSSRNKPLNELASSLMDQWYCGHLDHPYPTNEEKWQFAMLGGITVAQVSSWFANRRTRTSNTKPKKNRSLLLRKLQDFCGELERASHGLLNASEIEQRFQALFNEFHP